MVSRWIGLLRNRLGRSRLRHLRLDDIRLGRDGLVCFSGIGHIWLGRDGLLGLWR